MHQTTYKKNRYIRYSNFYDILEAPMKLFFSKWRKELVKYASGHVLEVGVGTGKNLKYYPEDIDLTAIDFSQGMLSKVIKKYGNKPNINFIQMDIQTTDFESDSFNLVIASYVFCSVPDPVKGLKEIKRICKNNGKIILLELVRSENKIIRALMELFNPVTASLLGFNINRYTENNVYNSGLHSYLVRYLWYDILRLFIIKYKK